MKDPFPQIPDEIKCHALAITIGRYLGSAEHISRLTLNEWLCFLNIVVEVEMKKDLERWGRGHVVQDLPLMHDTPVLAQQIIARWKNDPAIQARFSSVGEYLFWVEEMFEGARTMESSLLP